MRNFICVALALTALAAPVQAQTGTRELLTQASFVDRDKASALRKVQAVVSATDHDTSLDARILRATALGYRAKLTGSRSDLTASRKLWDAVVAASPRDAEGQLGLGAWHLGTLSKTGALLGRVFGANRATGNAALDRAVALAGNRAFFPGIAGLFRLKADPADARGRQLVEQAANAGTATSLDRIMKRAAGQMLSTLRGGNAAQVKAAAHRLLPLGTFSD